MTHPAKLFHEANRYSHDAKEGVTELQVDGTLRLHGVEKLVTVPVRLRRVERNLTADGELPLLQSSYGIVPIKAGEAPFV
jgi:polyisoprenoid-binding protein YceI